MALLFPRPILAKQAKVARWDFETETYGTPVRSRAIQEVQGEFQYDADNKKVGGATRYMLAVPTGIKVKIKNLGYDILFLEVVTTMTHSLTGAGTSAKRTMNIPFGENFPYFGLIVKFLVDGGGDLHAGFPLCKMTKALDLNASESSEFSVQDVEIDGGQLELEDGTLLDGAILENNAQEQDISDDFNTFFGI